MAFDKKIFSNSAWMILEKFLGIFGLIFVNAYMARYIGPENFGKLAFVASIFVFVQTVAWFGCQNVLFKRLSQNVASGLRLALASQILRRTLYCVSSAIALTYLWFFSDTLTFLFGLGNCIASYFIVSDIFTIHNNSQLVSHINALTNILGLGAALILRFILVVMESDVYMMIFPIIILAMVPYILRKLYFYQKHKDIKQIGNGRRYNQYMFITGGSLVLSTLSIALYTQISNIFLAKFSSFADLGVYNVAIALGGAWGFVNVALITSYFSRIYATSNRVEELKYLRQVHGLVLGISLLVLFGVVFLGNLIIQILYGLNFIRAAELLPYIVIATMLSAFGTISYRYMIKYNGYQYLSIKMLSVALLSIPLSYGLIKYFGVMGAAVCFILVEFISLTIANYFFKNGFILKMHLNVILK
ncbi:oligosaccharide flippase family protein [Acinetobacter haemolyticus]|uniref:oligosaccharide flippase family protein n=1 Tax=Acinetobacter haemolyticus TaxID=29430 RepID=UPI0013723EE1|nr:oligosaccharide flippase family protein [Acinetobacter haemolyticus]NAS00497.1 oligosaccharide flippase family protein [Acinetobacter haemolyticus]